MAKKQAFGEDVVARKAAQKRMAKVVISTKGESGKFKYREAMVEQDAVKDFIQNNKD